MVPHVQDLFALDRDVARAARSLAQWRAAVERGEDAADDDPFQGTRHVAGKSTWTALGELPAGAADEPLRAAIRRWVLALVQARIGLVDELTRAREAREPRGHFEGARPGRVSWRDAWRNAVTAGTPGVVRLWLSAAADAAPPLASLQRLSAGRRAEVARRMGLGHPWEQRVPVAPRVILASASRFLERTDDLARAVRRETIGEGPAPEAALHAAIARDAGDGWPARLTPRWLEETFRSGLQGLSLELPPLPHAAGASSFARAMTSFGQAYRRACAPRAMPFSLAFEAWFLGTYRFGYAFGALAGNPEFHQRALGLGSRRAAAQARVLGRTALFEARLGAARLILDAEETPRDAFEDVTIRLFGGALDGRLRGAWPGSRDAEPARWLGLLGAPALVRTLREAYDTDWFRNPRAWTHLRALGAGPAYEAVEEAAVTEGGEALARAFEDAVG
jgi:hypothetical protein